jgi:hypothetical protein
MTLLFLILKNMSPILVQMLYVLMYDNAGPHIARIVTDGLNYADIQRLDWPARSPDLNLFEHGIILGDE